MLAASSDSDTEAEAPPRRLPLVALYTANAVSQTGDMLMFLAIPWFVLQTTGSVAQTGITTFFTFASVGLSALFGSTFVDRLGFQRASVASDLASMVGVALIPLLYATIGLPFWALLALVFLAGLLTTPGQTARYALIPDLAQLAHARIERVTAARDSVTRLSRFVGAPLAGILIAVIGTSNLLWIDAATFALSALVIGAAVPVRLQSLPLTESAERPDAPVVETLPETTNEHSREPGPGTVSGETLEAGRQERADGFLAGLREGIAFLWHDGVLRDTTLVVFLTNALDTGQSGVLAPAFVKEMYGNAVILGAMIAAFGGAAFAGTIVFGAIGHKLPRRLTLTLGYSLGGGSRFFWIVLLAPAPAVMVASQAICGFCIGPVNPIYSALDYERVPVALRARVFGVLTAGSMLGAPLGGLLAGAMAPAIGVEPTMLLFGIVYSLATLSLLVNPALRELDQRRGRPLA